MRWENLIFSSINNKYSGHRAGFFVPTDCQTPGVLSTLKQVVLTE